MAAATKARIPSSTPTTVPATAPPPFFLFASPTLSAVVLDADAGAVAGTVAVAAAIDDSNAVRVGAGVDVDAAADDAAEVLSKVAGLS